MPNSATNVINESRLGEIRLDAELAVGMPILEEGRASSIEFGGGILAPVDGMNALRLTMGVSEEMTAGALEREEALGVNAQLMWRLRFSGEHRLDLGLFANYTRVEGTEIDLDEDTIHRECSHEVRLGPRFDRRLWGVRLMLAPEFGIVIDDGETRLEAVGGRIRLAGEWELSETPQLSFLSFAGIDSLAFEAQYRDTFDFEDREHRHRPRGFVELGWNAGENLLLMAGVGATYDSKGDDLAVIPSVGIVFRPADDWDISFRLFFGEPTTAPATDR